MIKKHLDAVGGLMDGENDRAPRTRDVVNPLNDTVSTGGVKARGWLIQE